jgi:hypothetical protein
LKIADDLGRSLNNISACSAVVMHHTADAKVFQITMWNSDVDIKNDAEK